MCRLWFKSVQRGGTLYIIREVYIYIHLRFLGYHTFILTCTSRLLTVPDLCLFQQLTRTCADRKGQPNCTLNSSKTRSGVAYFVRSKCGITTEVHNCLTVKRTSFVSRTPYGNFMQSNRKKRILNGERQAKTQTEQQEKLGVNK